MTKHSEKAGGLAKLRDQAERRLKKIMMSNLEPQLNEFDALKQVHELQVSHIELELQNSELIELQLTQQKLGVLLEHYTNLYEFAPMGYFTVCCKGILREVNLNGAKLLGVARSNLVGQPLRNFVASKYRLAFDDFLVEIFSRPGKESSELEFVSADKKSFFAQIEANPDDSRQNCLMVMRDISSRKILEEALRNAHEDLGDEVRKQAVDLVRANDQLKSQVAEQKLTEQVLEQTKDMLRDLGVYQARVKEDERKRIAREIHDELGGLLTAIKAHLSVALVRLKRAGLPEDPELVAASTLADSAVETVRRVVTDLRPSVLDQLGVWAALEWYVDQFKGHGTPRCEFRIDAAAAATIVDSERSTALYRIVQEALTNVIRHSDASHVSIQVARQHDSITVTVQDNGKGISIGNRFERKAFGIVGMRERAIAFGGELAISGEPGRGTLVTLRMPLVVTRGK